MIKLYLIIVVLGVLSNVLKAMLSIKKNRSSCNRGRYNPNDYYYLNTSSRTLDTGNYPYSTISLESSESCTTVPPGTILESFASLESRKTPYDSDIEKDIDVINAAKEDVLLQQEQDKLLDYQTVFFTDM